MKRIELLIPIVKKYYQGTDPAHDWPHVGRVVANARLLSRDLNVNLPCLLAATYCHDLINLPKNHPDRKKASELAANEAEDLLLKINFEHQEIFLIKSIIKEHSFSLGLKPSTLEAAILQDADRLDALGAIGILRCAAVSTQMGGLFYEPVDPLAKDRELDDKKYMLDHYYTKLFKLPDLMNTEAGKKEAQIRVEYMKKFIEKLIGEVRFY